MVIDLSVYLWLVLRVAVGGHAISAPGAPLRFEKAVEYAAAATFHGARRGIDPFELVALARNESDFVENKRSRDGKDCGLTQTRLTVSHFSCRQLEASSWLAFQEAARELHEYSRACQGQADFDRCRLNRYNSGRRYARRGVHGAYWLRVTCFAAAARLGLPVGDACRFVRDPRDVSLALERAQPRPALMAQVSR